MKKYAVIIVSIIIFIGVMAVCIKNITKAPYNNVEFATTNDTYKEEISQNENSEIISQNTIVEEITKNDVINKEKEPEKVVDNSNVEVKKTENNNSQTTQKSKTTNTTSKQTNTNKSENSVEKNTTNSSNNTTDSNKTNNQSNNEENKTTNANIVSSENSNNKSEEKHIHAFEVNEGWFNTSTEAIAKFKQIVKNCDLKYENSEKTPKDKDKYIEECPIGYELFRCSCGMFGLNLSYRLENYN